MMETLHATSLHPDILIAFVLTTELELSMGKMWQAYAVESGITSRIFRTRSEADAWIKDSLSGKRDNRRRDESRLYVVD